MIEKVSVIIPTWNRKDTIIKAIDSALNQTYPVSEVIVSDDGSTDNTEEIITKINDTRLKFIKIPHSGRPATPRNYAINISQGEWLAFLDSDDSWQSDKIEKQIKALKETKLKASCTNATKIKPETYEKTVYFKDKKEIINFDKLLINNEVICSSVVIHRSLIEKVKGFPEEIIFKAIEDYCLWLRVALLTDFYYIDEPLVIYTDSPGSSVRSKIKTNIYTQKRLILKNLINWAKETNTIYDVNRVNEIYRNNNFNIFKTSIKRIIGR